MRTIADFGTCRLTLAAKCWTERYVINFPERRCDEVYNNNKKTTTAMQFEMKGVGANWAEEETSLYNI